MDCTYQISRWLVGRGVFFFFSFLFLSNPNVHTKPFFHLIQIIFKFSLLVDFITTWLKI